MLHCCYAIAIECFLFSFKSSPALPVLIVNGKQTWLAVPNGDSNPGFSFFSLGSEKKTLKNKSRSRAIQIVFYLLFTIITL